MHNTIMRFEHVADMSDETMHVYAYAGGYGDSSVYFSMGTSHCLLSESEVNTLIDILQKRLNNEEGYRAKD